MPLTWIRSLLSGALAAVCISALAQPGGAPHVTRQGQALQQLEESLLQAMREKDSAQIDKLLGDDFEMIVAQDPGNPVIREDWIDAAAKPGAGAYTVEQISVRDFGEVAIASFVLRPAAGRAKTAPVFIVDTWQRSHASWRLARRHAALVLGKRSDIPGDAVAKTIRKMI